MPRPSPVRPVLPVADKLELLETRVLLTAAPAEIHVTTDTQLELADSTGTGTGASTGIGHPAELSSDAILLPELHEITGVSVAHDRGLTGLGQTVVIVDSGIAYDHPAFGGDIGEGHHIVGGWDFTEENDADPYDDPPGGYHGTHVAGILASQDESHLGVAYNADVVALRVFSDLGRGKLSWLESSLDWIAEHQYLSLIHI